MKSICKALVCGLALTAATAVGCSSGPSTTSGSSSKSNVTGELGLRLTLQGGQNLASLGYVLTNPIAADDLSGTIPLGTGTAGAGPIVVPTFEIVPVQAATGYTITLSGSSSSGSPPVTCTGTAGPFTVTAGNETVVNVLVTCVATNEAGSIEVITTIQNCPSQGTLTAINATANTSAPGNTSTIFAAVVSPNEASLTYAFSVASGTGTLSGQTTASGNVSSSIIFTCPATAETDTIQLVTSDQTGAVCPASLTTSTVTVTCGNVPACQSPTVGTGVEATPDTAAGTCPTGSQNIGTEDAHGNFCCTLTPACTGVGSGIEATPDTAAGTCPGGSTNSLKDSAGNFCCSAPLVPCTTAGQTGCVSCQDNSSGVCSPTEADFVNLDITSGVAKVAGPDSATGSCYACLGAHSCIDDTNLGDTGNECEDTAPFANGATGSSQCEAVISCILASGTAATQCASTTLGGANNCYCGTDATCTAGSATAPVTAGVNGVCDTTIATALGFPLGDGSDIEGNFTNGALPGGRAAQIFVCAAANKCNSCL